MARASFAASVLSTTVGASSPIASAGRVADVVQSVASTTVAADVATLVADGASPTQGHVNTLNTDWAALLAGLPGVPGTSDVVLSFNIVTVGSQNVLRKAVQRLLHAIEGSNVLVP